MGPEKGWEGPGKKETSAASGTSMRPAFASKTFKIFKQCCQPSYFVARSSHFWVCLATQKGF